MIAPRSQREGAAGTTLIGEPSSARFRTLTAWRYGQVMSDERPTRGPQRRSPDQPDDTQPAVREDLGTSMGRPPAEEVPPTDSEQPGDQRGPAGAGVVPGRGKLGSWQQPEESESRNES